MVHRRAGIDDHVRADLGVHVDDRAGDQQRARADDNSFA